MYEEFGQDGLAILLPIKRERERVSVCVCECVCECVEAQCNLICVAIISWLPAGVQQRLSGECVGGEVTDAQTVSWSCRTALDCGDLQVRADGRQVTLSGSPLIDCC